MSDFEKLITAFDTIRKARADYIEEFSSFTQTMGRTEEDLKRAKYLEGKADAIKTAYSILNNLIEQE